MSALNVNTNINSSPSQNPGSGINSTPSSVRMHIAFFGRSNAGKSSLINAVTGQETAIVSEVRGTTTDPVYKAMEILPIGPCVLIDTAGLDDIGELGQLRVQKTMEVLHKTDIAVYIVDGSVGISEFDTALLEKIREKKIPVIIAWNKADVAESDDDDVREFAKKSGAELVRVSAKTKEGVEDLKKAISQAVPDGEDKFRIVGDLIRPGDFVVLVTPIDKAAPKGRLILPQQQTIRDILECDAVAIVSKEHELRETLAGFAKKPRLVITDSQVFLKVAADTPKDIMLTSFSILFARFKGDLTAFVKGVRALEKIQDGDRILIAEGCTHHQQSDDIGRVKIPRWIRQITGKKPEFVFASGSSFIDDAASEENKRIEEYKLIVHCGGCMLNRAEMLHRIGYAQQHGVPVTNYGIMIAYIQGILGRVLEPFPLAKLVWEEGKGHG